MTVTDLMNRKEEASRAFEMCRQGSDSLTAVANAVKELKALAEKNITDKAVQARAKLLYDEAFKSINAAGIALNQAKTQCCSYESLLGDIARATEIDWPPKCGIPK